MSFWTTLVQYQPQSKQQQFPADKKKEIYKIFHKIPKNYYLKITQHHPKNPTLTAKNSMTKPTARTL